jgi:hypothetical protein
MTCAAPRKSSTRSRRRSITGGTVDAALIRDASTGRSVLTAPSLRVAVSRAYLGEPDGEEDGDGVAVGSGECDGLGSGERDGLVVGSGDLD